MRTLLEHSSWIIVQVNQIYRHLMICMRETLLVFPERLFQFGQFLLQSVHSSRQSRRGGGGSYSL